MKYGIILLVFLILVPAQAGTSEEAFLYMCRLRKWVQAGINFNEYNIRARDLELAYGSLISHSEHERRDNALEAVTRTMKHYMFAREVWEYKYSGPEHREFIPSYSRLARDVMEKYPEVITIGSPGEIVDWIPYSGDAGIKIDEAVSVIFMKAGEELQKTQKTFFKEH